MVIKRAPEKVRGFPPFGVLSLKFLLLSGEDIDVYWGNML